MKEKRLRFRNHLVRLENPAEPRALSKMFAVSSTRPVKKKKKLLFHGRKKKNTLVAKKVSNFSLVLVSGGAVAVDVLSAAAVTSTDAALQGQPRPRLMEQRTI